MYIKSCIKLMAVSLSILGLFGCSAEREAEKLGFANVSEMNVIHKQGWHTKSQYDADIAAIKLSQEKKLHEDSKALKENVANSEPIEIEIETEKNITLSKAYDPNGNDPTGLAHLFVGQIAAVGYGVADKMKGDEELKILAIGVFADSIEGEITNEAIKAAFKRISVKNIQIAETNWNGRKLPATLITVDIATVNRSAGKYNHSCMKLGGIMDKEFDMIRSTLYVFCEEDVDPLYQKKVDNWKESIKYTLISNY